MFKSGQKILLWGDFEERKTRLQFMLRKLGVKICSELNAAVDCIIVGKQSAEEGIPGAYLKVTEQEALTYLKQKTEQSTAFTAEQWRAMENLRLLLQHPAPLNRELGLSMLQEKQRSYCFNDLLFGYLEYYDRAIYAYLLKYGSQSLRQALPQVEELSLKTLSLRVEEIDGVYLAELFWRKSQQHMRKTEASHFLLRYSNKKELRQVLLQEQVKKNGKLLLRDFLIQYCPAEEFAGLKHITNVMLQGRHFEQLPDALLQLPGFKELHLVNVTYSDNWELQKLPQLYALRFSGIAVDEVIGFLQQSNRNLRRLGLTGILAASPEKWEALYQLLEDFLQLEDFYIIGCGLEVLPPFQRLPQLRAVDLSNNNIAELPAHSNALQSLRRFSLYDNQLQSLPPGLFEDTLLEEVILSNNSPQLNDWLYAHAAAYFPDHCEVKYDNVR